MMSDLAALYKLPDEIMALVKSGFLVLLSEKEDEWTVELDIPSMGTVASTPKGQAGLLLPDQGIPARSGCVEKIPYPADSGEPRAVRGQVVNFTSTTPRMLGLWDQHAKGSGAHSGSPLRASEAGQKAEASKRLEFSS